MSNGYTSKAVEVMTPNIECDIKRRLLLAGMVGAVGAFTATPLFAQITSQGNTTVSSDGIVRTILQSHEDNEGNEFRLVMTTYPPGVGLPVHHHPSAGFNYILEGIAESQYVDEPILTFRAGDSYQDKANAQHLIFRNADRINPLKYLIAYTTQKGQPFLMVP
ncbi:cupin domain-containing protein [Methylomonas sp. CM2]|uniref:cupin domain-containing protein n=1 Tax=Methylomonas sp. CM2 TaxID=3417647 RepID=UPI003CF9FD6C